MNYDLHKSIQILERTPKVVRSLLQGLHEDWVHQNEGGDSWSPFDIVGHLVHGEKTDWIARTKIILQQGEQLTFETFDRFAQFEESKGKNIDDLLNEFEQLRKENLRTFIEFNITPDQYSLKGIHPQLGEVTLSNLLATWVTHDLGHIAQISRVLAKQYQDQVGPWQEYLPILHK